MLNRKVKLRLTYNNNYIKTLINYGICISHNSIENDYV